jgi:hypothetical protein
MNVNRNWHELMAVALVGTDRRSSTVDPSAVLDEAAAWAAYRRAGVLAPSGVKGPLAAGPEDAPAVGDPAAARLAALVAGDLRQIDVASRMALLEEWLSVAVERGRLVPPALLPDLLDYGRYHRELRERIVAVGGVRLQWLAGQSPEWNYLSTVESTAEAAWETGTAGQRVGFLRGLRHEDPEAGRALLERDWSSLTADERGDLVGALATGLGPADEPLLERGLDDRRKEVRDQAARLLAQLPGSAYGQRMAERARAALRLRGATVVDVVAPAEYDRAMRRDGVTPKPPSGTGERAWWLEEILARTPLATWPGVLIVGAAAADWAVTVHRGLARAVAVGREPRWAAALLDRLGDDVRDRELAAALYAAVAPADLVERAVGALAQGRTAVWGALLAACPAPWPMPLARAALAGIESLAGRPQLTGDLHRLCRLAAVRLDPATVGLVEQLSESTMDTVGAVDALAAILRFRHEMIREIA